MKLRVAKKIIKMYFGITRCNGIRWHTARNAKLRAKAFYNKLNDDHWAIMAGYWNDYDMGNPRTEFRDAQQRIDNVIMNMLCVPMELL